MRKLLLALALIAGALVAPHSAIIAPGFAAAPPPVPAEPDAERRTRYSGVSSVTTFPVGFDIYGDGTDYTAWVEVWVNGVKQTGNWSLVPTSGSFTTLSRPLLAANLNIVFTTAQSGTIDIVGARRPRRTSQLSENSDISARDFNQIVTDMWMTQRERWDRASRTVVAPPGETLSTLPPATTRANGVLGFGATGDIAVVGGQLTNTTVSSAMLPVVQGNTLASARAAMGVDNASNLNNGTVPVAQLPSIPASLLPQIPVSLLPQDNTTWRVATTNDTVLTSDCLKTVQLGTGATGFITSTLPAVTGFPAGCEVTIKNADTARGKKLSGYPSGLTSPGVLWPLQVLKVKIVNGAWVITQNPGRWLKQNAQFYVDTSGNDNNDGLASGTSALATLNGCRSVAQNYIDTASQGNGGVTCLVTAGQTFKEFVQVFFPLVGGGTLIYQGNGGQFNWVPADGLYSLQFGDLGVVGLTNVNFTTTGSTSPSGLVTGHNYGIVDFNTGITFTANSPAVTYAMDCDFDTHWNINNGLQYVGTFTSSLFHACQNSSWNFNNNISSVGTTSLGRMFIIQSGSRVTFGGNVTWGATGLSTSVGLVSGGAIVNHLAAGSPPGGAPTPTTGGQYCTTLC